VIAPALETLTLLSNLQSAALATSTQRGVYAGEPYGAPTAAFADYFRIPAELVEFESPKRKTSKAGYFTFSNTVCFGHCDAAVLSDTVTNGLAEVSPVVEIGDGFVKLPFDLTEVVSNLRGERYFRTSPSALNTMTSSNASRMMYYLVRPLLPVPIRKYLQRIRLSGWERIAFPQWPVDCSVDALMRSAMALALKCADVIELPFIWFWPDGAAAAAIITHDIETRAGQAMSRAVMDLDDAFGFKSAFQIVPEVHSSAPGEFLREIRQRGFEGNIHDLNHDGHLFRSRQLFEQRAEQINRYAATFGTRGFRAAAMHRVQDWFGALDMSFDMSVPNVAHLEPQRGGCCTVMPYFIGHIVELPLTTIQDYSLFHILADYSTSTWKQQIESILSNHGLITILTHPDYLKRQRAKRVYAELLRHLRLTCEQRNVWATLPSDVDDWWRSRQQMRLVREKHRWRVDGPDSHRARVAYATLENGRVVYKLHGTQ